MLNKVARPSQLTGPFFIRKIEKTPLPGFSEGCSFHQRNTIIAAATVTVVLASLTGLECSHSIVHGETGDEFLDSRGHRGRRDWIEHGLSVGPEAGRACRAAGEGTFGRRG